LTDLSDNCRINQNDKQEARRQSKTTRQATNARKQKVKPVPFDPAAIRQIREIRSHRLAVVVP
jgi:hypothetical protein